MESVESRPPKTTLRIRFGRFLRAKAVLVLLVFLLAVESGLTYVLCTYGTDGWLATGFAARLSMALAAAAIPLFVGGIILFRKGRRFSIRSILIATACLAIFLAIVLLPLIQARRAREAASTLGQLGIGVQATNRFAKQLRRTTQIDDYHEYELGTIAPEIGLFEWLRPLAGKIMDLPEDRQVLELYAQFDDELKLVCELAERIPNLQSLTIVGCSSEAVSGFLGQIDRFPKLEFLTFHGSTIPENGLGQLKSLRLLQVAGNPALRSTSLSPEQLEDISRLANLEVLMFTLLPIADEHLDIISRNKSLKHIVFTFTDVTDTGKAELEKAIPNCDVQVFRNRFWKPPIKQFETTSEQRSDVPFRVQ